jgi:dipeptidyl-peptidase-4
LRLNPFCLATLALCAALSAVAQKPLTVEDIFAHGRLTGKPPENLTWSPDGKRLTYMEAGELLTVDAASGRIHTLVDRATIEKFATREASEKDRDHRERYKASNFLWAPDSTHVLFDASGVLYLYDLKSGASRLVADTGSASGEDPKFSPDGRAVSFLRNHGLTVVRLDQPNAKPQDVAAAPNATTLRGEVDWVYDEELNVRSNYFWSPDAQALAFLEADESAVPEYPITDWIPTHAGVDAQRYPQPGDPNPAVRVGIVPASGGAPVWVKLPIQAGQDYIPRFGWADARTLWIETLSRSHKHRAIYFADAATGESRLAVAFEDAKFFDERYDVAVGAGSIVLSNWTDGHQHLYLYSYSTANPGAATLERQLTKGDFDVTKADTDTSKDFTVDFAAHHVRYASNEGGVLDQQLWQVDFDGHRTALTQSKGEHEGNFAPTGEAFVDRHSTRIAPPAASLCSVSGKCAEFWHSRSLAEYGLREPQVFTAKAADGTTLYATLLLPAGVSNPASVPLIVNPYGGPGEQTVSNSWGDGLLFDTVLAEHGFAVLHADNRGSAARGRDFAQACYHNFGPVQLADQLAAADVALASNPVLDAKRLGWWGWSWGGSFTLYALSHSDRFRAGVSVAPVTDWHNYDSIYTERYMSEPKDFPEGYKEQSVVSAASHLHGRLLLVHGTGDDNVHMENSIQYIQQLIEAQIPYDLQLYPRKTHSISGPDVRTHLYTRILNHFESNLK